MLPTDTAVAEARTRLSLPGVPRRVAAGAWHVPAGFMLLLRHPSLWPLAVLPVLLALVFLFGGFVLGVFALPFVESVVVPHSSVPGWLRFVLTFTVWIGTLAAGVVLGLATALLLSSPVLERLSRRVEAVVRGGVAERGGGLRWELAQAARGALYFLAAAPGVLVLGLIPFAGPALAALWGAHALAFQQTDAPLARRGLDFRARRAWHRRWRPESLGFGLAGVLTLLVPLANLLLTPALAAGATLLVLELEEGL